MEWLEANALLGQLLAELSHGAGQAFSQRDSLPPTQAR